MRSSTRDSVGAAGRVQQGGCAEERIVWSLLTWWWWRWLMLCQIGDAAIAFYNQFMPGTKKNLPLKCAPTYRNLQETSNHPFASITI